MSYRSDPETLELEEPSTCVKFLIYTWKTITCIVSHVTLVVMVVSYCVGGAHIFNALEEENEKNVKMNISNIRNNITESLWLYHESLPMLYEENFTDQAKKYLKDFELELLKAMTKDGWDGNEDVNSTQWTIGGSLFYSIIVITTIGKFNV